MIARMVRGTLKSLVKRSGFEIVEARHLYPWQVKPTGGRSRTNEPLPPGAEAYLRLDNPRLVELRERYARVAAPVTSALIWTEEYLKADDLTYFRGDNPYVFQLRGRNMNELSYMATYYAAKAADGLGLFSRLDEDRLFGIHTFEIDGRLVSRDLLDSITELTFLERHLDVSRTPGLRVLDIGAGYGRLAYRATTALPSIAAYLCTDAVPQSTFVCEYYLRFRGVDDRARVVPLDEIEAEVAKARVDLAVNIHSFSECSLEAIEWWMALLARNRVSRLMIVPNFVAPDGVTMQTNARRDFSAVVHAAGYRLLANEPKYLDPVVQKYGLNPARVFLFGLD